jgi:hypothetical protein
MSLLVLLKSLAKISMWSRVALISIDVMLHHVTEMAVSIVTVMMAMAVDVMMAIMEEMMAIIAGIEMSIAGETMVTVVIVMIIDVEEMIVTVAVIVMLDSTTDVIVMITVVLLREVGVVVAPLLRSWTSLVRFARNTAILQVNAGGATVTVMTMMIVALMTKVLMELTQTGMQILELLITSLEN